jgi:predicted anti-sigma-YlaC factor YlaD
MATLCRTLLERLGEDFSADIGDLSCERLGRHLATCPDCRLVFDTTRRTVALYRRRDVPRMPHLVEVRLHDCLRSAWKCRCSDKQGRASG